MNFRDFAQRLEKIVSKAPSIYQRPSMDFVVSGGIERAMDPAKYHWDGMKRGGDPNHPFLLFQYTLDGWGIYSKGAKKWKIEPGMAFVTIVPSAHRYYLPRDSSHWYFFWFGLWHPYIPQRLKKHPEEYVEVLKLELENPIIARATVIFESIYRTHAQLDLTVERQLFDWLFEYEYFSKQARYPEESRLQLSEQTRRFVLAHLKRPINIEEIARSYGKSRSHFSHFFKATTGLSPAAFITEVRLEEVRRRLKESPMTLKEIVAETGFADPNHLCKVFRRHYHISPGVFRRQLS